MSEDPLLGDASHLDYFLFMETAESSQLYRSFFLDSIDSLVVGRHVINGDVIRWKLLRRRRK